MSALTTPIRQAFTRAAPRYADAAHFQRDCGERLRDGLPAIAPARIVDVGCGTGHGLDLLAARWPQAELIGVDFALPMLRHPPATSQRRLICADAHAIPMAAASVDLFWSNLTLQWCDSARFFSEAARLLRPGALLAVSTLGPQTFAELRQAFAEADHYRHANDFLEETALRSAITGAGLHLLSLQRQAVTRYHGDLRSLLGEVRDIGANSVRGDGRRAGLMGKAAWHRFEQGYERQRQTQGLPLTYDTVWIYARK